jgi:microcystin degradation protein MlrC
MRIAIAELAQETDSFSTWLTDLSEFEANGLYQGRELVDRLQGAGPLGGFLEVVSTSSASGRNPTVEIVPLMRAWACAGGRIADATFARLRSDLLDRLRAAGEVDAVFLSLHGAASSESDDDVEGAVLEDVRRVIGPDVPLVVPLDHHANITRRMVAHADMLVGHETQPHDPPATGRKAARLLLRWLAREIAPVRAWQKIPMITPQDQFLTSAGPMQAWFEKAREFESRPEVLDVSPYPMQPWLDVEEGGWTVVVHTDGNADLAREIAAEMAEFAWELRRRFWASERIAPAEAVRQAGAAKEGLVILSDTGDSVYGGAPGDNTGLLRELLRQPPAGIALVPVVDAEAVAAAFAAGAPAAISLPVGGRHDRQFSEPVEVAGRVAALSEGVTAEIPGRGVCQLGRTALIVCGTVHIVVLEHRSFAINHPLLYAHLGIDVADAQCVVVKTASNFQYFAKWRKQMLRVNTPGTTQSDLAAFHWTRLPRPIDPFDEIAAWQPAPEVFRSKGD